MLWGRVIRVGKAYSIPPKYADASVIGFLKRKSAIATARPICGKERNFKGEHLLAREYAVSALGFELGQGRQYIRDQEEVPLIKPSALAGA